MTHQTAIPLSELPAPPAGKSGWPWTEGGDPWPETMPNGEAWPTISVVTPSYNQADFLEETIRSVLLQGAPSLQYSVIDGASNDGSKEIIEKYAPWLDHWESTKDRGQSHAINKGLARCDGEIVAWLNSDDTYLPNTLQRIATEFRKNPQASLIYGLAPFVDTNTVIDEDGTQFGRKKTQPWNYPILIQRCFISQPACFMNRAVLGDDLKIDESLHYVLDWELWLRAGLRGDGVFLDERLATYRMWEHSKSVSNNNAFKQERLRVLKNLSNYQGFKPEWNKDVREAIGRIYIKESTRLLREKQVVLTLRNLTNAIRYAPSLTVRQFARRN